MPEIIYLRDRSIFFRRLAKDYGQAGQHPVYVRLTEVAADFAAQAIAQESKRRRSDRFLSPLLARSGSYPHVTNACDFVLPN